MLQNIKREIGGIIMPLPVWLIPLAVKGAALAAGAAGVGTAVHGASQMKDAKRYYGICKEAQ